MNHVALSRQWNSGTWYWCGAGWSDRNAILVDLKHVEWMRQSSSQDGVSNSALALKYELQYPFIAVPVADLPPDVVITGVLMPYTGASYGH